MWRSFQALYKVQVEDHQVNISAAPAVAICHVDEDRTSKRPGSICGCRTLRQKDTQTTQLLVLMSHWEIVHVANHNSIAGHLGLDKAMNQLMACFYWPDICMPLWPLQLIEAFERIGMDLIKLTEHLYLANVLTEGLCVATCNAIPRSHASLCNCLSLDPKRDPDKPERGPLSHTIGNLYKYLGISWFTIQREMD